MKSIPMRVQSPPPSPPPPASHPAPPAWRLLAAVPHRLFFAAAMLVLLVSASIWAWALVARAGLAGMPPLGPAQPVWHLLAMLFGFFAFYMFGFLFTAGPRWLDVPPPAAAWWRPAGVAALLSALVMLLAPTEPLARAGAAAFGLAWLALDVAFARLLVASRARDKVHASLVLATMHAGASGPLAYAAFAVDAYPWLPYAGMWLYAIPVFFLVCHRMIPFFTASSELFGHEKGSFTGAVATRQGCFERADGGTIFLDEIGELRPDLQVRLLRVLQDGCVQRVGASTVRKVNMRVVAATNRDPRAEVKAGRFREDLYFRLAVFPITLPPLRDRIGDIELLAQAFLEKFAARHKKPIRGFASEALRVLAACPWPGNVRELENIIERAVILEDGTDISLGSIPAEVYAAVGGAVTHTNGNGHVGSPYGAAAAPMPVIPFSEEERRIILRALGAANWNVQEAAAKLELGRATVYRKIERYGLRQEG